MSQRDHIELLLRALLERPLPAGSRQLLDDPELLRLAVANVGLLRMYKAIESAGSKPPHLTMSADAEHARVMGLLDLISRLASACDQAGIPAVFPKAFQHWPDMGHDIDLLVLDERGSVDRLLRREFGARPSKRGVFDLVAGKTGFTLPDVPGPVEVHHARMGRVGDLGGFARDVIARRRNARIGGIDAYVPCDEDQLIIQVVQRVYDHFSIRLSDAARTLRLLAGQLDRDVVIARASALGIRPGLELYLEAVGAILRPVVDDRDAATIERFVLTRHPRSIPIASNDGRSVLSLRALSRLYLARIGAGMRSGDVDAVGRLVLTVPLAGVAIARGLASSVARSGTRRSDP